MAVADFKTGDGFAVAVREGDSAMDVFHHPFAYAAWRRIATGSVPADEGLLARLAA